MANIKDFIKKIGNSAVSLEEQQQALAQVEKTIIEAKQKRTEVVGKNADMVIQALKTIEAKLEAKLTELNNTPAKQGVQGPVGKDGKDGKDGKAGRDGLNGKDGTDGKDGVDGKDGISVVDAKIDFDGSLVVYLSNGSEIDCGQILQPEVAKNIIISSGGSGTSQVVTDTLVSLQNQINTLTGIDGTLGSMAQQDANAVAITGGTINGTTIGATTPSTVNATTLSGQTGVLRGTGSNLIGYSQAFDDAVWTKSNSSITANSTTAPDGTTTADTLVENTANNTHYVYASANANLFATISTGATYTASVFAKPAGRNRIRFSGDGSGANLGGDVLFDVSTGTVVGSLPSGVTSASIVSAGNGWYRCIIVSVATATVARPIAFLDNGTSTTYTGDGTSGVFLWGVQLEFGSTANLYVATTPTRVYGTPTLSFSGVSTLGLESNGALFLQPAGTGAIQAQATTSTTAGGNARGANAVDWQTTRNTAAQVASGQNATISGGDRNTASGFMSAVVGGFNNTGGATYTSVGAGYQNSATGRGATIPGGYGNTAAGFWNFIGSGALNSGTANAAVTTQATTTVTSGSTAVTLSGSNANIRVGQLITGTGINDFPNTYVAAISGTSLTLSQNATASGSPTLSFFTPHGIVVGGGNNQATGSYSFIGGGGDAGTAGNRNVASGDWSFVGGGIKNVASGTYSSNSGGNSNTASGQNSFIGAGFGNTSSGFSSIVGGGNSNLANSTYSAILGGFYGTSRSIQGNTVFPASVAPFGNGAGLSQSALLILGKQTTDATASALTSDGGAASGTNQVILPNNSAYYFKGSVIANVTGAANGAAWSIEGAIMRGANAASTVLIDTPSVNRVACSAGATAWVVAVTADTTNGGIAVTVTGVASTTIRWVAKLETTEVTF